MPPLRKNAQWRNREGGAAGAGHSALAAYQTKAEHAYRLRLMRLYEQQLAYWVAAFHRQSFVATFFIGISLTIFGQGASAGGVLGHVAAPIFAWILYEAAQACVGG